MHSHKESPEMNTSLSLRNQNKDNRFVLSNHVRGVTSLIYILNSYLPIAAYNSEVICWLVIPVRMILDENHLKVPFVKAFELVFLLLPAE